MLGAPLCVSHRERLYATASNTRSGTPNSCAAAENAACSEPAPAGVLGGAGGAAPAGASSASSPRSTASDVSAHRCERPLAIGIPPYNSAPTNCRRDCLSVRHTLTYHPERNALVEGSRAVKR